MDFGSYFQDYLDPGYRTTSNYEDLDRPSFEQFLSQPSTLSDHLMWQLGSISLREDVRKAAEAIVGNLNEDGGNDEAKNKGIQHWITLRGGRVSGNCA